MSSQFILAKEDSLVAYLKKVWDYRYFVLVLASRELKVKYAQSKFGILWSALQPLAGMIVFTIFFDKLIKIKGVHSPYPLFAFSGMLGWNFFSFILNGASTSLIQNQGLIQKIYFPKFVLPLSKVVVGLIEFLISLTVMLLLMLFYAQPLSWAIVFLPIVILMNILVGLCITIWINALTVRNRDLHHIVPYMINFSIWLTPVFYPGSIIPQRYFWLTYLNPMAGVLDGYRYVLLGEPMPSLYYGYVFFLMFVLFVLGLMYFKKVERYVAELI
jgi:lipopolysaccharide transport system permease protein